MSALSTGLRLQVFSFPWKGLRALNPRRGGAGQDLPTPDRLPPVLTSGAPSPLTTRSWSRGPADSLGWEGPGRGGGRGVGAGRGVSTCDFDFDSPLIHSAGAALISSEVQQQISGEYHEKPGLQSERDGTAIAPPATGASFCASADKELRQ